MTLELMLCEQTLIEHIANPRATRDVVANVYGMAIMSSEARTLNWRRVNEAIIARWSRSALEYIKRRAWSAPK